MGYFRSQQMANQCENKHGILSGPNLENKGSVQLHGKGHKFSGEGRSFSEERRETGADYLDLDYGLIVYF